MVTAGRMESPMGSGNGGKFEGDGAGPTRGVDPTRGVSLA